MLLPSEAEGMKAALAAAKIPLRPTKVNAARASAQLTPALQALLSKTLELKVNAATVDRPHSCKCTCGLLRAVRPFKLPAVLHHLAC